jgi:apolipoprotein N-acyltransferase
MLAELARAWIFTGFPWAASGYALIDSPWVGLAPWLGVYGMAWVAMAVLAMVVLSVLLRQGLAKPLLLGGGVLLGAQMLRFYPFALPNGPLLQVALLQGNVPQNEKFSLDRQVAALQWHAEQLALAKGDLVVIPETAIPLLPADLPGDFWPGLLAHFHASQTATLVGVPLGSFQQGYTNSVVGISPGTRAMPEGIYRYNKHHLVPFGEFIPWGFRWFVNLMHMPLGDFTRGPQQAPSFEVKGQWVAPNICYEDLFGEELAARFVDGPTPPPTVLANVSNLAWFGKHVAIEQHLQVARMRSLEFQRPTIRATNTGATVVIDHQGRVTARWPLNERGVLHASVQGMQGLTPFARWAGAWGLMPLCLLAGVVLVCCKKR